MNNLAKEINTLLLENETIKEYLNLKKEINEDEDLNNLKEKLDDIRKESCKNKKDFSEEYYKLLDIYTNDSRIKRFQKLQKDINEYFSEISDILSLK